MEKRTKIKIASRKSPLALAQTNITIDKLKEHYDKNAFEVKTYLTTGDKISFQRFKAMRGSGLFVGELRKALLNAKADFAVHSLKDMPTVAYKDFTICSYLKRDSANDVLLTRHQKIFSLKQMPKQSVIGTHSDRRIEQIKCIRTDFIFKEIKGNITTRINKLQAGLYDGIVLAACSIKRLNLNLSFGSLVQIPLKQCVSAAGQGVIAVECLSKRRDLIQLARYLQDPETAFCAQIERRLLQMVEGSCGLSSAFYCSFTTRWWLMLTKQKYKNIKIISFINHTNKKMPTYNELRLKLRKLTSNLSESNFQEEINYVSHQFKQRILDKISSSKKS